MIDPAGIEAVSSGASVGNLLISGSLVLVAIPGGILAYLGIKDRSERREQKTQRAQEQRLTELIAKKLLGNHVLTDPDRAEKTATTGPPLVESVAGITHQVRPSNGKTVAQSVEETQKEMARLAVLVGEHMSDGHGGQIWPPVPHQ